MLSRKMRNPAAKKPDSGLQIGVAGELFPGALSD